MNTKQLQYFLATADQGSITGAARKLGVAQPAISLQLANLEHELKIKLFERGFKGVELNNSGQLFEKRARLILTHMEEAKAELIGDMDEYKGEVIVGLSSSCCNVLSIELLTELENRFPNIKISFKIGQSHLVKTWLANDKVDIALTYDAPAATTSERTVMLLQEDLYLYLSHHPKNPAHNVLTMYNSILFTDLKHYDIFMPSPQDALYILLNNEAAKNNITLKPKAEFGQLMTTLHYVTVGFGLVILPSSGAYHLENSNLIRTMNIIQPKLQRPVYLQMATNRSGSKANDAVYELIREVTANVHAQGHWRGNLIDKKYSHILNTQIDNLENEALLTN